ncbi:hypothetical protein BDA99DRAFT_544524 [Phascolomyces articulosus]|uniref:Uncharacterized protein n=1 Tax=Phascolomyces articulosus TaxID=60185 RepID=A0AAD5P6Q3_9FUNG|nr:hypothetical protein BDA99DRAFT_544524 [Phascolomyces articulosus]
MNTHILETQGYFNDFISLEDNTLENAANDMGRSLEQYMEKIKTMVENSTIASRTTYDELGQRVERSMANMATLFNQTLQNQDAEAERRSVPKHKISDIFITSKGETAGTRRIMTASESISNSHAEAKARYNCLYRSVDNVIRDYEAQSTSSNKLTSFSICKFLMMSLRGN